MPRRNEALVEMKYSHSAKSWDEIELFITKNLQLSLAGKPWIANNGRQYMTVGFRTSREDFENWKCRTLNWQESGIRGVTSSQVYR